MFLVCRWTAGTCCEGWESLSARRIIVGAAVCGSFALCFAWSGIIITLKILRFIVKSAASHKVPLDAATGKEVCLKSLRGL